MVGDEQLVRAVGHVAAERAWTDILLAWADRHPADRAALDELADLTDRPAAARFSELAAFSLPVRPPEVSAHQLRTPLSDSQDVKTPRPAARTMAF